MNTPEYIVSQKYWPNFSEYTKIYQKYISFQKYTIFVYSSEYTQI